jgi:hypothetical protein
MCYLLDVYFFPPADIELNSSIVLWPEKISPIFDQSEQVSYEVFSAVIIYFHPYALEFRLLDGFSI